MQTRQQDSAITLTNLGATATAGPWAFTVTKVVAGDEAATMIANANSGNPTVPDGLVYMLASVRAKNTGSVTSAINLADFAATGSDGTLRRPISMAVPEPALQGTVKAGAELEGWLPLAVNDATGATLWYDSVVLAGNWSNIVLALVDGATLPDFATAVYATPDANAGSDPANPAGLNQTVQAGDWAVTVLRTASGQEIYDMSDYRLQALSQSAESSATEIATWYGVYARITNLSAHPAVFSPNAMELADTSGEPWDNIMALTAPDPDLSREVMPGATREGWAAFQLQPYVTNFTVRIMPSAVADKPRYVSLDGSGTSGSSNTASSGSSTPASTDTTPLAVKNGGSVTVNDSRVNLRKEPKTGSGIVAELAKGTALTVTGDPVDADGYRWYPVTVVETGDSGYVVQDYITAAGN